MIFNTTLAGGTKKWRRPCLKFSSEGNFQITFSEGNLSGKIEVSKDGTHWSRASTNSVEALFDKTSQSYNLYISGTGNKGIGVFPANAFVSDALIDCSGYIETLLDWETVAIGGIPAIGDYAFANFFGGLPDLGNALRSAPSFLSTDLPTGCYTAMFRDCTNLITLPKLPASSISGSAYNEMFSGCSKIMLSETQSDDYPTPYRVPFSKDAETVEGDALIDMFAGTGGTFTGTPEPNKTYYLHKSCRIV